MGWCISASATCSATRRRPTRDNNLEGPSQTRQHPKRPIPARQHPRHTVLEAVGYAKEASTERYHKQTRSLSYNREYRQDRTSPSTKPTSTDRQVGGGNTTNPRRKYERPKYASQASRGTCPREASYPQEGVTNPHKSDSAVQADILEPIVMDKQSHAQKTDLTSQ